MQRYPIALPVLLALTATAPAPGAPLCRPGLALAEYQFAQTPARRVWTGRFTVDASRCANASGPFSVEFVRTKENAPDLRFAQQFTWTPGKVEATTDFGPDEFVLEFAIGDIAACPCRE